MFTKIKPFLYIHLKIWPAPIITRKSVYENKTISIHSLENLACPYYHELRFLQKYPRFNEVIWTFELLPLSWCIIFSNIKQFWWCLLKIWPAPRITSWNFANISNEVLMMSLNCPYYQPHFCSFQRWSHLRWSTLWK